MYIETPSGISRVPEQPEGYREAMARTERGLYDEYVRACPPGMRILQRLERTARSPRQEVEYFERRLRLIPRLFRLRREAAAELRADPTSALKRLRYEEARRVVQRYVDRYFAPGYALSTEEQELAKTRCELSRARWRFIASVRHGTVPGRRGLPGR